MEEENVLRQLRRSLRMTQKDLAAFCGVTERTIQKWEAGGPIPQIVQRLVAYMNAEKTEKSELNAEQNSGVFAGKDMKGNRINSDQTVERMLDILEKEQNHALNSQDQVTELILLLKSK